MNFLEFENYVKKNIGSVSYRRVETKEEIENCGGWFCDEAMEIVVWGNSPEAFQILVHEYNHYIQYHTNFNFWDSKMDDYDKYMKYVDGEADYELKDDYLKAVIEIELDCEKRSVKMIDSLDLDINPKLYIKNANAHLFSTIFKAKNKKWPDLSIYDNEITKFMPGGFLEPEDYMNFDNLSKNVIELFNSKFKQF